MSHTCARHSHTHVYHTLPPGSHPGFLQVFVLSSFSDMHCYLIPSSSWPLSPLPYTDSFLEWALNYKVGTPLSSSPVSLDIASNFCLTLTCPCFFTWEGGRKEWWVFKVEFVFYVVPYGWFLFFLMTTSKGKPFICSFTKIMPYICGWAIKKVWLCSGPCGSVGHPMQWNVIGLIPG